MNSYRNPSPQEVQVTILKTEFFGKISYDFSTIVYLGLTQDTKNSDDMVPILASRDGYVDHKHIYYKGGQRVFNFYVKFRNDICAEKAVIYFRSWDKRLNVETAFNLLLNWYIVEMMKDSPPTWTTACVDFISTNDINALETRKVQDALRPFGYIRIPHRQASTDSVRVLFNSFSEALGSTIALGGWVLESKNPQSTIYRVRIVRSSKEERLFLAFSGGSSISEAFELDYFLNPRSEFGSGAELKYEAPERQHTSVRNIYRRNHYYIPRSIASRGLQAPTSKWTPFKPCSSKVVSPNKSSVDPLKCKDQNTKQSEEIHVEPMP